MTYFHDLARGLKGEDAPQLTPWAAGLQKGRTGSQSRRRSVYLLSPAGRAPPEPSERVQDRADAVDDDLPPRIVRREHVPADLHRWPSAAEAERNRAGLAGIFGRPLGGRRVRRREHRVPRQRLAQREHGVSEQRRAEGDRTLAADRLRPPGRDRHHRRSQGLRETVDEQDHPDAAGGHRDPRFVLRQPGDHAGALRHGSSTGGAVRSLPWPSPIVERSAPCAV